MNTDNWPRSSLKVVIVPCRKEKGAFLRCHHRGRRAANCCSSPSPPGGSHQRKGVLRSGVQELAGRQTAHEVGPGGPGGQRAVAVLQGADASGEQPPGTAEAKEEGEGGCSPCHVQQPGRGWGYVFIVVVVCTAGVPVFQDSVTYCRSGNLRWYPTTTKIKNMFVFFQHRMIRTSNNEATLPVC